MPRIAPIIAIAAALCFAPSPAHADAEPAAGEASGTPDASGLTPSQRTRLETAADGSTTVDEAAFYALLESVRDAPPAKAGSVFPDFAALRADPAAHRGQQVYIEGRLLTVTAPLKLGREGFDGVRPFIIQIDRFGVPWSELTADDMVIVYVADPLAVSRPDLQLHPKLLAQTGAPVRVAARFYKVKADKTEAGVTKRFLAFVAQTAEVDDAAGDRMDPTVRNTLLFACGIAAMLVYWFIRIAGIRKRRREGRVSQVEEFLQSRERRRKEQAIATGDDDEHLADLPDDPVAAMAVLEERRKQTAEPPAFTLDDETPSDTPPSQGPPDGAGDGTSE